MPPAIFDMTMCVKIFVICDTALTVEALLVESFERGFNSGISISNVVHVFALAINPRVLRIKFA